MKRVLLTVVIISFFMATTAITSLAASEHESHHPDGATSNQGMMNPKGMGQMPCMAAPAGGSMSQMMGMMGEGMGDMMGAGKGKMMSAGKMGMMGQRMEHMFYLDRTAELGLSTEQIKKLKALHTECRKDNIRNAAEVKIARLELTDLLGSDNWSLKDAEAKVLKVQKLEGDIQIRHLQGLSAARKVLTAEQLQQARSGGNSGDLENLFQ